MTINNNNNNNNNNLGKKVIIVAGNSSAGLLAASAISKNNKTAMDKKANPSSNVDTPFQPDSRTTSRKFFAGKKIGKLTLIKKKNDRRHKTPNKRKQWLCRCECTPKEEFWVPEYYLKRRPNPKRDCGCSRRSNKMTHNKEYRIWYMMNTRTTNKDHVAYKNYGGRGISVCDRWKWGPKGGELDETGKQIKDGFTCFLEDIGPRPSPDMSIDRINNDDNYRPGNVKWATATEQAGNRRTKEQVKQDIKKFEDNSNKDS